VFRFKRKSSRFLAIIVCSIFLASFIPHARTLVNNLIRTPLVVSNFITREIRALLRFHINYKENIRLNKEIEQIKKEITAMRELELENKRLKQLLDFKQSIRPKLVAARVIAKDAANYSSSIIIDKGLRHKLKQGQVVLNHYGLVGRIIEPYNDSSKVLLITDPRLSVSCIVQRTRLQAIASGSLGGRLIMRYIDRDFDLQTGDFVITSGLTQNYPKGIAVGRIVEVGKEFGGLSLYAVVKPAVEFSKLEEVLVVIE